MLIFLKNVMTTNKVKLLTQVSELKNEENTDLTG